MLRMTATSSTHRARCGYRSETAIPAWPCRANLRDEPSSAPGLRTLSTGSLSSVGIGLPLCRKSSGLGSNVSTWLTPPYMNRTMHALALAGKWGALGASGESRAGLALGRGGRSRQEPIARPARWPAPSRQSRRRLPRETRAACGRTASGPAPSVRRCQDDRSCVIPSPIVFRPAPVSCCKQTRSCSKSPGKTPRGPCGGRRSARPTRRRCRRHRPGFAALACRETRARPATHRARGGRPSASANARSTWSAGGWPGLGDQPRGEVPRLLMDERPVEET